MTFYPVCIPTLNRYDHFRQCVESLARCTHADKTELVIGLDYPPSEKYVEGWEKIKAYIPTITGFAKVTVFQHEKNLGPGGNFVSVRDYCIAHYPAYIASEDDNVFSPNFLDFTNQALDKYADDPKIMSVCGFSHTVCECPDKCNAYLTYDSYAWGMGVWPKKDKQMLDEIYSPGWPRKVLLSPLTVLKILCVYPYLIAMLWSMATRKNLYGDLLRAAYNFKHNTRQLRPARSLVRNIGCDGTGQTWGGDLYQSLSTQPISQEKTFDFGPEYPICSNKGLFFQLMKATKVYLALRRIKRTVWK